MANSIDFRADQVQTSKIIVTGSTPQKTLLVYGIAAAADNQGNITPALFNTGSIGSDVFLFVSGTTGGRGGAVPNITVIGGDFHVSGNLTVDGTGGGGGSSFFTEIALDSIATTGSVAMTFLSASAGAEITGSFILTSSIPAVILTSVRHGEPSVTANGKYAYSQGQFSAASGDYSHAQGDSAVATGAASHSHGTGTLASGPRSHAEGYQTTASGDSAHSEGSSNTASGVASHAEGFNTVASNFYSHSEGTASTASGVYSHAEGNATLASAIASHAEGENTTASGQASHAEGFGTTAGSNSYAHAEGYSTLASGYGSHAEGYFTTASINYAHAEGSGSVASGYASHAEGDTSVASFSFSHAEGTNTAANNIASHAEGSYTVTNGEYSHAEGSGATTYATASHAEGFATTTYGDYSHAEGQFTSTYGLAAHAEGYFTVARGESSHAEGYGSEAYGTGSLAAGLYTVASGAVDGANPPTTTQAAFGKYNLRDNVDSLFVVGDGLDDSNRHDVLRVNSGSVQITGSLFVNGTQITSSIQKLNVAGYNRTNLTSPTVIGLAYFNPTEYPNYSNLAFTAVGMNMAGVSGGLDLYDQNTSTLVAQLTWDGTSTLTTGSFQTTTLSFPASAKSYELHFSQSGGANGGTDYSTVGFVNFVLS